MDSALGGLFYVQPYLSMGYLLFHQELGGEECNQWCACRLPLGWGRGGCGGGDSGGNQQKKQKVARIYFHCVPVSFVLILRPPASLSPGGTQRNACDWLPEHLHHTPACNPQIPGSLLGILKFPKAHPSRRLPAVQPHHTGCVSLVSLRRET